MGSFCKSLKIKKTIAYVFNNILLNWSIIKGGLRGFLTSKAVIGVCYIRVFCKFPGWSLLWTTTMVHDSTKPINKPILFLYNHSPLLFLNAQYMDATSTFNIEVLHLVTNVWLLKCLLQWNEQLVHATLP